ncbi:MAG: Bug family tripartite tricarboxylate transporter substrate binding protein [Alphaproteobacteria bacterium]
MANLIRWALPAIAAVAAGAVTAPQSARAQDSFYKGKQVRLIIGYGTGGGYDSYARLLTKHIGKHIPGNPTVVPQNMPGAGSTVAANHIFNIAPKDGLVFGTFARALPLAGILDPNSPQIKFKPAEFTWIGSSSSYKDDAYILLVRAEMPIKTVQDIRGDNAKQMIMAATNAGSTSYDVPVQLLEVLGLKLKIIHGYPDGAAMSLAIERKEADGRMIGLSAIRATQPDWLGEGGFMRPLLQFGRRTRHEAVKDIPMARELAQGKEDLALIEMLEMPFFLARPYAAPPGVPKERAAILMKAFMATHKDKDYLADAKKQKMDVSPIDGDDIRDMLTRMNDISPALVARYKEIADKTKPADGGKAE